MATDESREAFDRELEIALEHLYDPSVLRRSGLMAMFALERHPDATLALQSLLNESIASLKPAAKVPAQSGAWRVHRVLLYRFTEQLTQTETASDLGLSVRQLRRVEKSAIKVLADTLYSRCLQAGAQSTQREISPQSDASALKTSTPTYQQELDWLARTTPVKSVPASRLIRSVLSTAAPLLSASKLSIEDSLPPDTPGLLIRRAILRQALLDIVALGARYYASGVLQLRVEATPQAGRVGVYVDLYAAASGRPNDEELALVRRLCVAAGAILEIETPSGVPGKLCFHISAPAAESTPVLVIDDNEDTMRLLQRYLAETEYRFIGMTDPQELSRLDPGNLPAAIVLDVMMPGLDGWEVLAQLRTSPMTCDIPVIVCTILPQESMALALGASGFLRKPVSRDDLLEVLGRQLAPPETASD